jgi:hypothetical protein
MRVKFKLTLLALITAWTCMGQARLKWIVYDFDGLNAGQQDLPDGDYRYGDLSYKVAYNPFGHSDMLGDRVLQIDLNWSGGMGEFGKSTSRYLEIDPGQDYLNFYFYNPPLNGQDVAFTVFINDDDNNDDTYTYSADDQWIRNVSLPAGQGWQLVSLPLNSFTDNNSGGNGAIDLGYTGAGGMLLRVGFQFYRTNPSKTYEQYFVDMISFSEGALPHGATIFDLPPRSPGDHCVLGAFSTQSEFDPTKVPNEIESLFANGKKIKYVNWFVPFSKNGTTTPNNIPVGPAANLLSRGYTPILTWEPLYNHLARLDPAQPRLKDLISGQFDAYYYSFGDKIAALGDTVIVRLMHEFEGKWYPWSLVENGYDPNLFITVFRYIIDKVRSRGAHNIKWMWCVNAEPAPYRRFNWIMSCYPGDNYVDIVATDIYNHPDLGVPDWKSFRYTGIESYYYLNKYLPHKPLYICEAASRERYNGEDPSSQTKAEWIRQMDKDMKSFFSKARALVFFSCVKEHDWRLNSSQPALSAITELIWNDSYYSSGPTAVSPVTKAYPEPSVFPNPFVNELDVRRLLRGRENLLRIYDTSGRVVYRSEKLDGDKPLILGEFLKPGVYILEVRNQEGLKTVKIVKGS